MTNKSNSNRNFIRFTALGFQMIGIISFFSWLGYYLDEKFHTKTAWWTIGLCLVGVFVSLYIVIREVLKINQSE
jgi:F0F1-type ATP synthase assembly protein I